MPDNATKMSAVELYKKLKDAHCTGTKLAQLRAWLLDNRDASAQELLEHAKELAHNPPRLGCLSHGTVAKMKNLMAGHDAHHGQALPPRGWDEELDGRFDGRQRQAAQQPNPPTQPAPIKTAGQLGQTSPSAQPDAGPVQNVTQPVLKEVRPDKEQPDLGPKASKKDEIAARQGYQRPGAASSQK